PAGAVTETIGRGSPRASRSTSTDRRTVPDRPGGRCSFAARSSNAAPLLWRGRAARLRISPSTPPLRPPPIRPGHDFGRGQKTSSPRQQMARLKPLDALRVGYAERVAGAGSQGGASADRKGDARVGVAEVHVGEHGKARKVVLTGNDLL